MKNQNDMIISIVSVVLALIVAGVLFATQPEPPAPVPVAQITTAKAELPQGDVVMANSLPGAAQGGGGGGGAGGGGGLSMGGGRATGAPATVGAGGGRKAPGGSIGR